MNNIKEQLSNIHRAVFSNFQYVTDKKNHDILEKWTMPDPSYNGTQRIVGDCEDFALACRKLCRDVGISNSRLAVANDETGETHTVLEVDGFVLDNRSRTLETIDSLTKKGYQWRAISGFNPGDPWHAID